MARGAHSDSSVVMSSDAVERRGPARRTCRAAHLGADRGLVQDRREVEAARLPVVDRAADVEPIHAADHLVHGAEAEPRHVLAHLLGDEAEEVLDVLGPAGELGRSSGSWVAMPTGQVLRWHTRIMMQPMHHERRRWRTRTPRPPSSAAITTSRPVFIWPSTWTMIRSRSLFITSTCCVSASPSSHGMPPCLIDVSGSAPVPPSWPEISTTSE